MTRLVQMPEQVYRAYVEHSIAEYAQDHTRAGRWRPEEALQHATEEYQKLLPDGLHTKNQYLFLIEDEVIHQPVGVLWFGVEERRNKTRAFVYDIIIYEQFRRRGYGEQAFRLLEEKVQALGLTTIGLHVFGHNHAAQALYQKLGYAPTNIMMEKHLS